MKKSRFWRPGLIVLTAAMVCVAASYLCQATPIPEPYSGIEEGALQPLQHLKVTIRHADGMEEPFDNAERLEIYLDNEGRIQYLHLVLSEDHNEDSHKWYQYGALSGFDYKFLTNAGKSKLVIKKPRRTRDAKSGKYRTEVLTEEDFLGAPEVSQTPEAGKK